MQRAIDLVQRLGKLESLGHDITIYPDAEESINRRLFQDHIESTVQRIRKNSKKHPLRRELLKVELLPYQLDGIAFAVGAGRAILADERARQYDNGCFFTICNYEQVLRDILPIEKVAWDLIILDEGQRIKNWEAKTSRVIKALRSPFAPKTSPSGRKTPEKPLQNADGGGYNARTL